MFQLQCSAAMCTGHQVCSQPLSPVHKHLQEGAGGVVQHGQRSLPLLGAQQQAQRALRAPDDAHVLIDEVIRQQAQCGGPDRAAAGAAGAAQSGRGRAAPRPGAAACPA